MPPASGAITFRRALASDARSVTRLLLGIYDEQDYFVGDGPAPERNLALRIETDDPHRALYQVALTDDDVVGWLELHRPPARRLEHVAVLTLAVAAGARRRGIGRGLLQRSYAWCAEVGVVKVSLHVRAGNDGAIALYEREGFELEGRERGQIRLGTELAGDRAEQRHGQGDRPGGSTPPGYEDNLIMGKWF